MALFFTGSIVFALARDRSTIIAGRVLQGLGGAGLDTLVEVILTDMTTLEERAKYLGLMANPNADGNIMGHIVGALVSTYTTCHWIGWINLPLLGIGATLVFFFLNLWPVPLDATLAHDLNRLDWIGMALVIIGITIFIAPLSWAGSLFPRAPWQTLLPPLLGVLTLVILVFYEFRPSSPTIPHRLFHSKTGNVTVAGGFIHGVIPMSLLHHLPLPYQAVELGTAIADATVQLTEASNAVGFIDRLRGLDVPYATPDRVLGVYLECFQTIFYTMTGLGALGLVTSFFLDESDLKGRDLGAQRFEE